MPFSAASFRTAGVALTSERSGRSAVAVADGEDDDGEDEDDIEGGEDGRCAGCGGTDSEVEGDRQEPEDDDDDGVADEAGRACGAACAVDVEAAAGASFG